MIKKPTIQKPVIDFDGLPALFPTHRHAIEFWEHLGRAVATFGFLERTLKFAVFSFELTRPYPVDQIDDAFERWDKDWPVTLAGNLNACADKYAKAVKNHGSLLTAINVDEIVVKIKEASKLRNLICHASWDFPDKNGKCMPFYHDKSLKSFDAPIDKSFLMNLQRHACELSCHIMDSVTVQGWQFPGTSGPGTQIASRKNPLT